MFIFIKRHHRRRDIHEAYTQQATNGPPAPVTTNTIDQTGVSTTIQPQPPTLPNTRRSVDMLSSAPAAMPTPTANPVSSSIPVQTGDENSQPPKPPASS